MEQCLSCGKKLSKIGHHLCYSCLKNQINDYDYNLEIGKKYKKSELISDGGMAKVFKAVVISTGTTVVWKEAAASRFNPLPEVNARLLDESEILSSLNHPRIPKYIDSGEVKNQNGENVVVMIMEYIEGRSLKDDIDTFSKMGRTFTIQEASKIIQEICEALDYMSDMEMPIYHRDIKPSNIIIHNTKGPVLIDFGLGKMMSDKDRSMTRGMSEGWSPTERDNGISGPFTDVFSLGQILWNMLTGERPSILSKEEIREKLTEKGHEEWIAEVIFASVERYDKRIQSVFEFKNMLEEGNNQE